MGPCQRLPLPCPNGLVRRKGNERGDRTARARRCRRLEVTAIIEGAIDSISRRPRPPAVETEAKQTVSTLMQLRDWAWRAHAVIVDKRDGFIRAVEELRYPRP